MHTWYAEFDAPKMKFVGKLLRFNEVTSRKFGEINSESVFKATMEVKIRVKSQRRKLVLNFILCDDFN